MQTKSMRVAVESISVVGVRLAAHMDITSGDGHVRISRIRLSIERFSLCHGFRPFFALNGYVLYLVFFLCQIRILAVAKRIGTASFHSVSATELYLVHHVYLQLSSTRRGLIMV